MRRIVTYKDYFNEFYESQPQKVRDKIDWTLCLLRDLDVVPEIYLKHMEGTDGLYEVRVKMGSNIYRIFCFFDAGNLIVLGNGFQKKTQKTPKNEIKLALKIMEAYFNEK